MWIRRYNPLQTMRTLFRLLCVLPTLSLVLCAAVTTEMQGAASELARQIASITGPGTVTLQIKNASSLSAAEVAEVRRAIEKQLRDSGLQFRNSGESAADVNILLSENIRGLLFIAEVQQGAQRNVAMVPVARDHSALNRQIAFAQNLKSTLLVSRPEPILDVTAITSSSGANLAVLTPDAVLMLGTGASKLEVQQSLPVVHGNPFPRDIRGRLVPTRDHLFDAYLPGLVCSSSTTAPIALNCRASDDPWPLGAQSGFYNSARNYFTGVLVPGLGKPVPTFYSAASLPRPSYTLWLFAAVDGQIYALDGVNQQKLGSVTRDWGSDIASVRSSCGLGTQVLVTSSGDDNIKDTVRAFEIADREPTESTNPWMANGPVTALWPSIEGQSAIAVVHNLQTGNYDAYSLSITCNQ